MYKAYNSDMLDKVYQMYGDSSKIKDMMLQRIEDLEKNGFYIDLCCSHSHKLEISTLVEWFEKQMTRFNKDLPEDFDLSKYYTKIGSYTISDGYHEFIHVSPSSFTFEYVDLNNMRDVLNISQPIIYANPFWGIYIKNDTLKIHDIIQYDFF